MPTNKSNHNPWMGPAAYSEPSTCSNNSIMFCGRDRETFDMERLVEANYLVTLYGKSGNGKTSLLQAGIFPSLRKKHYLPIMIRLGLIEDTQTYQSAMITMIEASLKANGVNSKLLDFKMIPKQNNETSDDFIWNYFARHQFYDNEGQSVIPVIVFDQFEEVLRNNTNGQAKPLKQAEYLLSQLNYTIDCGHAFRSFIEDDIEYNYQFNYRFILSIREDELFRLEDYIDHLYLPFFKQNRYRLHALSVSEAKDIISKPGKGIIDESEEEEIVQKIINKAKSPSDGSISPFSLSLLCSELFKKASQTSELNKPIINLALIDGIGQNLLFDFYSNVVKDLSVSSKQYIEDNLIDSSSLRNSVNEKEIDKGCPSWRELKEGSNRILQVSNGKVELVHDMLCSVISEIRNNRHEKLDNQKNALIITLCGIVYTTAFVWSMINCWGPAFYNWINIKAETIFPFDIVCSIGAFMYIIATPITLFIPKYFVNSKRTLLSTNILAFILGVTGLFFYYKTLSGNHTPFDIGDITEMSRKDVFDNSRKVGSYWLWGLLVASIISISLYFKKLRDINPRNKVSVSTRNNDWLWPSQLWQSETTFRIFVSTLITSVCIYLDNHACIGPLTLFLVPVSFAYMLYPKFLGKAWNVLFGGMIFLLCLLDLPNLTLHISKNTLYVLMIVWVLCSGIIYTIMSKIFGKRNLSIIVSTIYLVLSLWLFINLIDTNVFQYSGLNKQWGLFNLISAMIVLCIGVFKNERFSNKGKIYAALFLIAVTGATYIYRLGFNPFKINPFNVELLKHRRSNDAQIWTNPVVVKHINGQKTTYSICEPILGNELVTQVIDTVFIEKKENGVTRRWYGVKISDSVEIKSLNNDTSGTMYIDSNKKLLCFNDYQLVPNMLNLRRWNTSSLESEAYFQHLNNTLKIVSGRNAKQIKTDRIDALHDRYIKEVETFCKRIDKIGVDSLASLKANMCILLNRSLFAATLKDNKDYSNLDVALMQINGFDITYLDWYPSQINFTLLSRINISGGFLEKSEYKINMHDLINADRSSLKALNIINKVYLTNKMYATKLIVDNNNLKIQKITKRIYDVVNKGNELERNASFDLDSLEKYENYMESTSKALDETKVSLKNMSYYQSINKYCHITREPLKNITKKSDYDYSFMKTMWCDVIGLEYINTLNESLYDSKEIEELDSSKQHDIFSNYQKTRESINKQLNSADSLVTHGRKVLDALKIIKYIKEKVR